MGAFGECSMEAMCLRGTLHMVGHRLYEHCAGFKDAARPDMFLL